MSVIRFFRKISDINVRKTLMVWSEQPGPLEDIASILVRGTPTSPCALDTTPRVNLY